ncbi:MAG: DUF4339 domain-containing protein [Bacteroidetes Order II. Incertae sedis bacterium]|nr:DUF4339 domain-containing protein [Bacteroidetes Order II. bacterium]
MIDLTKQENIFIYHGGQQYGPMTYAQARQFMSKRPPTPSDLFWADGMKNWEPLPDSLLSQSALENLGGRSGLLLETVGATDMDQASNPNQTRALAQPPLQTTAETRKPESQTEQPTRLPHQKKEEPTLKPVRTGLGGFFIPVALVSLVFLGIAVYAFTTFLGAFLATLSSTALSEAPDTQNVRLLALFASFGSFAAVFWTIMLNVYLFRKKQVFPSMFRATIGVLALFGSLVFGFMVAEKLGLSNVLKGQVPTVNQWMPSTLTLWGQVYDSSLFILTASLALLLILMYLVIYISRSKRVRHTFIR